ncbi:GIY-YIG nuclease family protein [Enterobacter sp. Cy-643]|uniref:GIY-YIG nuclease family protein n=1 Tax=Enterobacter sp. Cy-643 TaxID=2608346 RepID=UPI0014232C88|nr:GIY-YIG nuclease family protein [Enterobacter sp. Cy-643]NIF31650.1 GIY-YIG nuclease family protein [Enterobacter sp. Cy-643]
MAGITVSLNFEGYWREVYKEYVPAQSGIYCVYACTFNQTEKSVSIRKLIYIGESADVRHRLATHNKLDDWNRHLQRGETLCYSVATIPESNRVRVEAALISKVTPPENSEYTGDYPYLRTTVHLTGQHAGLPESLSVGSL